MILVYQRIQTVWGIFNLVHLRKTGINVTLKTCQIRSGNNQIMFSHHGLWYITNFTDMHYLRIMYSRSFFALKEFSIKMQVPKDWPIYGLV